MWVIQFECTGKTLYLTCDGDSDPLVEEMHKAYQFELLSDAEIFLKQVRKRYPEDNKFVDELRIVNIAH